AAGGQQQAGGGRSGGSGQQRAAGGEGRTGTGGPGGGSGNWQRGGGRRQQQGQTVYVLNAAAEDKKNELRPVQIRTGITDGRYTQVVSVISGTLNPGDPVVTGTATVKVEPQGAGASRPGAGGPPRGLGRF
ncbi:MAG: hypothetical protein ACJ76N_01420, partial [Thermoanaerobaculia bacterium]